MRILVYICTSDKHISIHIEREKTSSDVMKNVISQKSTSEVEDISSKKDKSILKFAKTLNAYWLLLWIEPKLLSVSESDILEYIQKIDEIKSIMIENNISNVQVVD